MKLVKVLEMLSFSHVLVISVHLVTMATYLSTTTYISMAIPGAVLTISDLVTSYTERIGVAYHMTTMATLCQSYSHQWEVHAVLKTAKHGIVWFAADVPSRLSQICEAAHVWHCACEGRLTGCPPTRRRACDSRHRRDLGANAVIEGNDRELTSGDTTGQRWQLGVCLTAVTFLVAFLCRVGRRSLFLLSQKCNCALLSVIQHGVCDPDVTNVPDHHLWRVSVFRNEEKGAHGIYVKQDASLSLRTMIHL